MPTDTAPIVIAFVLRHRDRDWRDLEGLDEAAIEREPRRFVGGRNSWIAQTYLRMRGHIHACGWSARVADRFEPGTIAIVHRDDANEFTCGAQGSFLVVVRADRAPVAACDIAIVQNPLAAAAQERYLPLWPQPGLQARDPARGSRILRLAYQGRTGTAPRWFECEALHRALARRGVAFEVRTSGWDDYRGIDLALAAREDGESMLALKPATKVYNAWLAGVPMLAKPEPAYQYLRRTPLDFIEIRDADDVVRAVDLLRGDPRLYEAMVANGIARGRDFDVQATRRRWIALLEGEIVPRFQSARSALDGRRCWFIGAMARQKVRSRWHRMRLAMQRWSLRTPRTSRGTVEKFGKAIVRRFLAGAIARPPARR